MTLLRRIVILLSCAGFSFLPFGCTDLGTGPGNEVLFLRGQVFDEQGILIGGVGVHYLFNLEPNPGVQKAGMPLPSTVISYQLPHAGHVTLTVLRWYTRELLATLLDTLQNAGNHQIIFDASQFTNGVYIYRLQIDTLVVEKYMVLLNTVIPELVQSRPLAATDSQGEFVLPYEQFGFGVPFLQTSSTGDVTDTSYISPAIQLVLYKEGYQTTVQPVLIDRSKNMSLAFVLKR